MSKIKYYYAFTPGGTILPDTKAQTEIDCWEKLRKELIHMYANLEEIKERGYEVEAMPWSL